MGAMGHGYQDVATAFVRRHGQFELFWPRSGGQADIGAAEEMQFGQRMHTHSEEMFRL